MYSPQNKVVAFTHNNLWGCRLCLTYAQYHLTFYWIPHKLLPNIVILQRKVNWSLDYNKENLKEREGTEATCSGGWREAKVGRVSWEKDRWIQSQTSGPLLYSPSVYYGTGWFSSSDLSCLNCFQGTVTGTLLWAAPLASVLRSTFPSTSIETCLCRDHAFSRVTNLQTARANGQAALCGDIRVLLPFTLIRGHEGYGSCFGGTL